MIDAFETFGTGALTTTVLIAQLISLLWMGVLLLEFRHMYNKRHSLLRNLGYTMPHTEVVGRKFVVALYIVFTLGMTLVISMLYFFKPILL